MDWKQGTQGFPWFLDAWVAAPNTLFYGFVNS